MLIQFVNQKIIVRKCITTLNTNYVSTMGVSSTEFKREEVRGYKQTSDFGTQVYVLNPFLWITTLILSVEMVSSSKICTQKDVNIGTIIGLTPTTK